MKISIGFKDAVTFAASLVVGCGAAVAMASAAAVSEAAPSLKQHAKPATEVVRLEPVVVTVSKAHFETVRSEGTALVRANDTKKVTRG